jgi:Golgi phosphoprotein 3 (GPP34)
LADDTSRIVTVRRTSGSAASRHEEIGRRMTQDGLAGRMFLILHDPFTGKPGVTQELVRYGVVAAALADLMMQGRLHRENGRVTVTGARPGSTDDVSAFLLTTIQAEPSHVTRSWVESFTGVTYELVARALVAGGVVRREHGGRRLVRRNPDRFPAVDLLRAAGPRVRLEHMLRVPRDLDQAGAALATIISGLGMERVLDIDRERAAVENAAAGAATHLPADVRALIEDVAAAVSEVALTFRRL